MSLNLRPATFADTAAIVRLTRGLHAAINPGLAVDYGAVAGLAQALIQRPDGLMLVSERGGVVCGMLAASIERSPMSVQRVAVEHGWFCEVRGGGVRLLRAYLDFAAEWRADVVRLTTPPELAGSAALRRLGFRAVELTWVLDLQPVAA